MEFNQTHYSISIGNVRGCCVNLIKFSELLWFSWVWGDNQVNKNHSIIIAKMYFILNFNNKNIITHFIIKLNKCKGYIFFSILNYIIDCSAFVLTSVNSIFNTLKVQPDWSFLNEGKSHCSSAQASLVHFHLSWINSLNLSSLWSLTWSSSLLSLTQLQACYFYY